MPRGDPTEADRALVTHAARSGAKVTPRQIEAWRHAGALPRRLVTSRGRYGRRSTDPPGTPERLMAVCDFMFKTGRLAERGDVPRRRRVSEALIWSWYAGYPVPATEVRDFVIVRLTAAVEHLESLRDEAGKANQELPTYELEHEAAELAVETQQATPEFRRLLRGFRQQQRAPDASDQLLGGYAQILQLLLGDVDLDPVALSHLLDLGAHAGHPTPGGVRQHWLALLKTRLQTDSLMSALAGLTPSEWEQVRLILHSWNEAVLQQRRLVKEREEQRVAKRLPLIDTTARLIPAIVVLAALLPEFRTGLRETFDIELGD